MLLPLLVPGLAAVLLAGLLFVLGRRQRRRLLASLQAEWGQFKDRPRSMNLIAGYYRERWANGPAGWLDDRTWHDLHMDDVFAVLDRTESVIGQQMLYARLRAAPTADHLEAFEALVTRMTTDPNARDRTRLALATLRDPAGYDLWRFTQSDAIQTRPWHVVFPFMALTMAAAVVAIPLWPAAIFAIVGGTIAGLILRSTAAVHLRSVAGVFRQVGPLLRTASSLASLDRPDTRPIVGTLRRDRAALAGLRRIAGWAGRDATGGTAGDLGGMIFEYLNLLFCLDGNAMFFGAQTLRRVSPELARVIAAVGDVDAAVSVASYRAATSGWTRPMFRPAGTPATIHGLRHPLLGDAVPNSVTVNPPNGVIITGSNMSGKSTFLRSVGANVVLAQTINTARAEAYEAPPFVVRSCIGRADDPATGKSYYLVEVEAVLGLVRTSRESVPHLFLFDELFRGTNAVERVAAGEAVLVALMEPARGGQPHVVLAATHDQELVELLDGVYAAWHFADQVHEEGLTFDYRLRQGPATTRNAIALLELRGAPPSLVSQARKRVASMEEARRAG